MCEFCFGLDPLMIDKIKVTNLSRKKVENQMLALYNTCKFKQYEERHN